MTDATLDGELPLSIEPSYLGAGHSLASWLTSTDHKRIAILYAISITFFFFLGGIAIAIVRMELFTPGADVVSADTYNKLFTFHGIIMVWFFLMPSIPTTLGNFLLPLMIGARDVAFPKLNLFSWYLNIAGGLCSRSTRVVAGGVDTGWTFYTPFSTMFSNTHVIAAAAGVFIAGFGSIADRRQFHRDDTHAARTGNDMVPSTTLRLGDLCDQSRDGPGDAGARGDAIARDRGALVAPADLRSSAGWRSAAVPASVLVLQSSRRLHHDSSGHGRRLRGHHLLRAAPRLRVRLHGLCDGRHCRHRLLRLGPPYVRRWPFALCQPHLLVPVVHCGGTFGDQGLQLDRHSLSRANQLRSAHAVCARVSSACLPSVA